MAPYRHQKLGPSSKPSNTYNLLQWRQPEPRHTPDEDERWSSRYRSITDTFAASFINNPGAFDKIWADLWPRLSPPNCALSIIRELGDSCEAFFAHGSQTFLFFCIYLAISDGFRD